MRIVNPTARTITLYVSDAPGFADEFQLFFVRYRDAQGRPVTFNGGGPDHWWTPLSYSSQLYLPGREPSQRLTIAAGQSRDYSRSALFAWFETWSHDRRAIDGPCTAQLRIVARMHPRAVDHAEILGDWGPAPCPQLNTPPG